MISGPPAGGCSRGCTTDSHKKSVTPQISLTTSNNKFVKQFYRRLNKTEINKDPDCPITTKTVSKYIPYVGF